MLIPSALRSAGIHIDPWRHRRPAPSGSLTRVDSVPSVATLRASGSTTMKNSRALSTVARTMNATTFSRLFGPTRMPSEIPQSGTHLRRRRLVRLGATLPSSQSCPRGTLISQRTSGPEVTTTPIGMPIGPSTYTCFYAAELAGLLISRADLGSRNLSRYATQRSTRPLGSLWRSSRASSAPRSPPS